MQLTREERRRNRRDDITSGLALLLVVVIFVMVGFAEAYFDREQQELRHTAPVTMPEVEVEAQEPSAMDTEDIDEWHEFCQCYRDCGLPIEDQIALFKACKEFNIDYFLMLGLIQRETQFRNVIGDSGYSFGYCQVQPRYWLDTMYALEIADLMNPSDNFRTACSILVQLFDRYGSGNLTDVLTAYNSGHGGESDYASAVIANQEYWAAQEGLHQV